MEPRWELRHFGDTLLQAYLYLCSALIKPCNQRRHAHSKWGGLRFFNQVDFECSFHKTKYCRLIFSMFNTITPAWLNQRSARLSSAAKFKPASAGWHWAKDRDVSTALRIITITRDSVELMNAMTNQRRSDESSLKCRRFCHSLADWIRLSGEFSYQKQ